MLSNIYRMTDASTFKSRLEESDIRVADALRIQVSKCLNNLLVFNTDNMFQGIFFVSHMFHLNKIYINCLAPCW